MGHNCLLTSIVTYDTISVNSSVGNAAANKPAVPAVGTGVVVLVPASNLSAVGSFALLFESAIPAGEGVALLPESAMSPV